MPSVKILDRAHADPAPVNSAYSEKKPAAPLFGATQWLNSRAADERKREGQGRPRALDLFLHQLSALTASCRRLGRKVPELEVWWYRSHAPEFAFEKNITTSVVRCRTLASPYPVAIDNNFEVWRAFNNRAWPARFLIDAAGRIRHREFGEGEYDRSEHVIEKLLAEAAL